MRRHRPYHVEGWPYPVAPVPVAEWTTLGRFSTLPEAQRYAAQRAAEMPVRVVEYAPMHVWEVPRE